MKFLTFAKKIILLLGLILVVDLLMLKFGPWETLDAKLYYSGEEARAFWLTMGATEIRTYLFNECLDLVLIAAYTTFFYLGLTRIFPRSRWAKGLAILPGAFDLVETTGVIYALLIPGTRQFFDWLGVATFLKWSLGGWAFTLLLLGAGQIYFYKPSSKTRPEGPA